MKKTKKRKIDSLMFAVIVASSIGGVVASKLWDQLIGTQSIPYDAVTLIASLFFLVIGTSLAAAVVLRFFGYE